MITPLEVFVQCGIIAVILILVVPWVLHLLNKYFVWVESVQKKWDKK